MNVFDDITKYLCSKVIIQLILTNLVTIIMQWHCIIQGIKIKEKDILTVKFHSVAEHLLRYYNRNNKLITIICNLHITTKQLCKALNVPRLVLSNHCTKLGCSRKASTKREKLVAWIQRWVSGDVEEKMGETGNFMDEKVGKMKSLFLARI